MAELRVAEAARTDLEHTRNGGIERFGEHAAERHRRATRRTVERLSAHPFAGQRPEFRGDLRSVARRPRGILYTVQDAGGRIVPVIHQARDVAAVLADDA